MAATHEATAIAVLLPGAADVTRQAIELDAIDEDDGTELRSPYLRVGSGEQRAAEALVRSLRGRRLPGDIDVGIHEAQPILRVTARAGSARTAEADARGALAVMGTHFDTRQRAEGVPADLFLRLDVVAEPAAERIHEDRLRAMTATAALGAAFVVGLALVAERFAAVSRRVRAVRVTTSDGGPLMVLSAFAVTLVLVPQIHSLGPFAVTGPMAVGAVAGALWAAGRFLPGGRPRRVSAVVVAMAVFVATVLASYALAQLRALDPIEAKAADRHVAFLVMFAGITLLAAEGLRTSGQLRRLLVVFVAVGAVHALVGVLQAFGGLDLPGLTRVNSPRGGFPRVAGTGRHPIDFGVFCAVTLPLALHFATFARARRAQVAAAAGAVLLVAGAALSVTRSALLGLVVGAAVLLAGRAGRRRSAVVAGAVLVVALSPLLAPDFVESVGEMVGDASESPSIQSRVADYEPVFEHVTRQPFLGRGAGTFEPSVHFVLDNNYLSLLVEVGIVGVAAFLAVVLASFAAARSVRRRTGDAATRDLAQALAAAIAVVAVSMGTYDLLAFQLGGGSLFLLLGCAAALDRVVAPQRHAEAEAISVEFRPELAHSRT